jgi:tetratricopeptide (TPR) repeat protein
MTKSTSRTARIFLSSTFRDFGKDLDLLVRKVFPGLLEDKGDYDAAEPLSRRALAIAEKAQGAEHPHTGIRLNNLAFLLQQKGDYDGAEPLCRRALAIAERAQGADHPETGISLNNIAALLKDQGNYDAAEPLYRRVLAIFEAKLGFEHTNFIAKLASLGDALRRAGRHDDADKKLARAVELGQKLDFAGPFFCFAGLRIDQKRYEDAAALLQRWLEIRRRKLDPGDDAVVETIRKLADVYRLMGREADAVDVERQLLALDSVKGPS